MCECITFKEKDFLCGKREKELKNLLLKHLKAEIYLWCWQLDMLKAHYKQQQKSSKGEGEQQRSKKKNQERKKLFKMPNYHQINCQIFGIQFLFFFIIFKFLFLRNNKLSCNFCIGVCVYPKNGINFWKEKCLILNRTLYVC